MTSSGHGYRVLVASWRTLWSHFPIEESGSALGVNDGHMGVDEPVAEDLKTSTFLQSAILK